MQENEAGPSNTGYLTRRRSLALKNESENDKQIPHKRKRKSETNIIYTCGCKTFETSEGKLFENHAEFCRPREKSLWCIKCSTYYSCAENLRHHIEKNACPENFKFYSCFFCEFESWAGLEFADHMLCAHKYEIFKPCKVCKEDYTSLHCLLLHMEDHYGTESQNESSSSNLVLLDAPSVSGVNNSKNNFHHFIYHCCECKIRYISKIQFYRHMMDSHKNGGMNCGICGVRYVHVKTLIAHMDICQMPLYVKEAKPVKPLDIYRDNKKETGFVKNSIYHKNINPFLTNKPIPKKRKKYAVKNLTSQQSSINNFHVPKTDFESDDDNTLVPSTPDIEFSFDTPSTSTGIRRSKLILYEKKISNKSKFPRGSKMRWCKKCRILLRENDTDIQNGLCERCYSVLPKDNSLNLNNLNKISKCTNTKAKRVKLQIIASQGPERR